MDSGPPVVRCDACVRMRHGHGHGTQWMGGEEQGPRPSPRRKGIKYDAAHTALKSTYMQSAVDYYTLTQALGWGWVASRKAVRPRSTAPPVSAQ